MSLQDDVIVSHSPAGAFTASVQMNRSVCSAKLQSYMAEYGPAYPWTIGKAYQYFYTHFLCAFK